MLTNKWIIRTVIGLVATVAMIAAVTSVAMAAGPETRVVVVHVTDGSFVTPADGSEASNMPERASFASNDFWRSVNLVITAGPDGVGGFSHNPETGAGGGGGPDGLFDYQIQNGDTAAGLKNAERNCQDHQFCHVILVNYRQPASRAHRIAAKVAADELKAAGHKLHAVAIGDQVDSAHLGFNWYLSGQAFKAAPGEAAELVSRVAGYASLADHIWVGGHARSNDPIAKAWDGLSYIEKIWLNPLGCDLETQWLWSSDATCHDKR